MADFCEIKWSGREDSNLRPLPPENGCPAVTQRFFVASAMAACHKLAHVPVSLPVGGSGRTLGHCLRIIA